MAYKLDGKDDKGHRLWVQKNKTGHLTFCKFGCPPQEHEGRRRSERHPKP